MFKRAQPPAGNRETPRFNLLSEILFVQAARLSNPPGEHPTFQSLERDSVCSSIGPGAGNGSSSVGFQSLERDSVCSSQTDAPPAGSPPASFNLLRDILFVQASGGTAGVTYELTVSIS